MIRRMILPLLFGLIGAAILVSLGLWQVQRLQWKEAVLADIEARVAAPPVTLPEAPEAARDRYLPVTVSGRFTGEHIDVLASRKDRGAGYRVISAFETDEGRRILIDRGFLPQEDRGLPRTAVGAGLTGNLAWPAEVDSFTPSPDPVSGIWFARDVPAMAEALSTEPVLVVAATPTGDGIDPWPIGTEGIPNDHLGYAVTWFSLAVLWLGMTVLLLWRIRRRME
ncbi:SURF1 family protein [Cereibacter johrii]|uniref:SURF1-like protein n=1 Tax=Cereibacter johrii TaxID=445629 RepID=A0ABX5JEU6_9RHOB|nr:SURF1 family protein [Cereibacter johrii]ODM44467.1 cytochrome oxidase biogenesis protein Surf1, facilitates heme A insertion [Cereibacter johrii]PTM81252.1 surfeit locus 1 family protein [Cereibacter johrii]